MRSIIRRGTLSQIALIGAGALLLVAPGDAPAKKRQQQTAQIKTASSTVPLAGAVGATASATASCPRGTPAVGGGFATSIPSPGGPVPRIYESQRIGRSQWRASAANGSAIAGGTVTSQVYCRKLPPKTTVTTVMASATVPPMGTSPTATAICPPGTTVLSGGFQQTPVAVAGPGVPRLLVLVSAGMFPQGTTQTSWDSMARNASAGSGTITSYAYCAKPRRPEILRFTAPRLVGGFATFPSVMFGSGTVNSPRCRRIAKKQTKIAAGSFLVAQTTNEPLVYESRRLGSKRWISSAVDFGAGGSSAVWSLQVVGLCV